MVELAFKDEQELGEFVLSIEDYCPYALTSRKGESMNANEVRRFLTRQLSEPKRDRIVAVISELEGICTRYQKERRERLRWGKRETRRLRSGDWPVGYLRHKRERVESVRRQAKELRETIASLEADMQEQLGSMSALKKLEERAIALLNGLQRAGRPRDNARERWVRAVARIYRREFKKKLTIWKSSGSDSSSLFVQLLQLSAPEHAAPVDLKTLRRMLRPKIKQAA